LQLLRNFAASLAQGRLGATVTLKSPEELVLVAGELNRMSERLASIDEERRAFLAKASHELRTPISNVLVTLDALQRGGQEDPEVRRRFIQIATEETTRMSSLIQQLLELGRLDAGVVSLDLRSVSLSALLTRAMRALEPQAGAREVTLEPKLTDVEVHIDSERLLQAFLNVIKNAIEVSPAGGKVTVTSGMAGGQPFVEVSDEGPGVEAGDLPHIFDAFYSGEPRRRRGGTGLGLAIARRIVEAHGGGLVARNGEVQGAVFRFSLASRPEATATRIESQAEVSRAAPVS
jgi:signal transduction histidine kinase